MAAQTTTYEAILGTMVSGITAISPAKSAHVPFGAYSGEVDFMQWVDQNPSACFRKFEILNTFNYERNGVSDTNVWEFIHPVILMVAYPTQWGKYGAKNQRDADCLMDSDVVQIDTVVGLNGYANYPAGLAACSLEGINPVKSPGWCVLQLTYRLQYDRSY